MPAGSGRRRPKRGSALRGFVVIVLLVAAAAAIGLFAARQSVPKLGVALPGERPAGATAELDDHGPAPSFAIETLAGTTFRLERGDGPVVISFIAGWCGSCIPEAIAGGKVARTFGDAGVRVLAIDADPNDTLGQLRAFMDAAGNPPIEWAMDKTSEVTKAYEVRALDTTVVVDRLGRIVYRDEWPTDYGTLADVLSQVVE